MEANMVEELWAGYIRLMPEATLAATTDTITITTTDMAAEAGADPVDWMVIAIS